MSLYRTSKKELFLDEVAEFIFANFKDKFDTVKIILPNAYLCNHLQKIIVNKIGSTILPAIISVSNISSEKEETFKIPSEQIGKITALEERMILARIIKAYDKLGYNLAKSLALSSSLAKLFFEFEANNIALSTLKNLPKLDQAEHWNFIYDFLEFAYLNWQQEIAQVRKLTPAEYQKLMFNAELGRIKNTDNSTIIAGVIGNNKITQDFIAQVSNLRNGHVILPPLPQVEINNLKLSPEDPLYNVSKLTSNFLEISCLDQPSETILDNLLVKSSSTNFADNIEIIEFDHILHEAEYIAAKCLETIAKNHGAKIAVLITDDKTKNYFTAKFDKYGLQVSDLIGDNILTLQVTTLLLEIAQNICKDFVLKDFISLISHPLIISDESRALKRQIVKEDRFEGRFVKHEDNVLTRLLQSLRSFAMTGSRFHEGNLSSLLTKIINIAEELCPDLWHNSLNRKLYDTLQEIKKVDFHLDDLSMLPDVLKSLLSGGRVIDNESMRPNITFCSPNDVTLLNYDLLIYTNFVQDSYPAPSVNSPWLNNQMIEKLGIDSWAARFGNIMYDFYLNLHNTQILITRSIKNDKSGLSVASPFLFRLKHILESSVRHCEPTQWGRQSHDMSALHASQDCNAMASEATIQAHSQTFPSQISATDIETLMRAPYNFYAKKILNLRRAGEIEEDPALSEFGNMFHKIVELYTKNYGTNGASSLEEYAKELLDKSIFPEYTQKFWQLKIESIASDFISFDEQRRSLAAKIFSEARGELELFIAGQKLKIVAIADRIELCHQNKAMILDYKTGVIPSKKDVLSGMSPQLMIEAIILLEGGFADIGDNIETVSLVYVKINSSRPFITTHEINITKEDILQHKNGLVNLLSHYITTGNYPLEPNSMKYDDYKHLARR
jgi:ATP-dependent helicase/nuclease subunit B